MKDNIIYNSLTGNTKLLAETLDTLELDKDVIYIGFWTNIGKADKETLEYLKTLKNKKIFLFGTCGFGLSEEYFTRIINNTKEYIDESNEVIGYYMCVGKMPQSVKDRYLKMEDSKQKEMMIHNFDMALSHPDNNDLNNLINKVTNLKK